MYDLRIENVLEQMEKETDRYEALCQDAAETENAYNRAYLTTFLQVGGPMQLRESLAKKEAMDQYDARNIAAALKEACKRRLFTLDNELQSLRTLSANVRSITNG